jgi:UDP:flavonoid glycosyltransferase YjiC (YdhE family)
MDFELPYPDVALPPGDAPLVLVAPSTAKDANSRLIRSTFDGLADEDVRVIATTNRAALKEPIQVPDNAVLVDWLSYSQVMPEAALVVCHGGHGTLARALGAGAPVLCCPAEGDMTENALRASWTGAGLSVPWRLCRPAPLRWAALRILGDPSFRQRAEAIAAWRQENDGAQRGAELVEQFTRA